MSEELVVIGGGLAGSEAAWQAAERGVRVALYEMRPVKMTPAHRTGGGRALRTAPAMASCLRRCGALMRSVRRTD